VGVSAALGSSGDVGVAALSSLLAPAGVACSGALPAGLFDRSIV